ncbi:uncharacterized protein [Euphorbia lathyris]|uniref:uncharacterized protein n=1 Tax=Euphorbia lathyris TaxID=212925 RepID=UPI003313157A
MGLRILLALVATFMIGYIVKPQFYSRSRTSNPASSSCSCDCDCNEDFSLSLPLGLVNSSYADCGNSDPEIQKEMEKDIVALLSEEIGLQRRVANDSLEQSKALVMDARRSSMHYQREAEKCNSQTEICEEARERAEAQLVDEFKVSELWEKRARELGWEEDRTST